MPLTEEVVAVFGLLYFYDPLKGEWFNFPKVSYQSGGQFLQELSKRWRTYILGVEYVRV